MLSTSAHVYSEIYLHLNVGALWAAVLGREGNLGILRHADFRRRFLAPGFRACRFNAKRPKSDCAKRSKHSTSFEIVDPGAFERVSF
jgi:hypothetical protein